MKQPRSTPALIAMLAGLIACGVHFTLLYAMTTLACLRPHAIEPAFNIPLASVAITAVVLAGLATYLAGRLRVSDAYLRQRDIDSRSFLDFVMMALVFLATLAVLWVTLPALMITDCRA
jgi:hypothetical protein